MPQLPPPYPVPVPLRSPSRVPLVLLALAAIGGAVLAYSEYRGRVQTEAALSAAKNGLKGEKAKRAALEAEKLQLEADKLGLEAAKNELLKSVQVKDDELAALKGTYDRFREKLKDEIAHGDIHLEQTGGKLRVGLVDKLLFDSGEAEISKRGEKVLLRLAEVLAGIPDKQVQVSGHTDREPIVGKLAERYPTNWELSTARATQVVRFLAERADVPPQRLVASGYGEHRPIASNKTSAGRARNRRIEILLTPILAPKTIAKSKLRAAVEKQPEKAGNKPVKRAGKKRRRKP